MDNYTKKINYIDKSVYYDNSIHVTLVEGYE